MRRTGTSKPTVWRWQQRYLDEGVADLKRDKTRPSRVPPLPMETRLKVIAKTVQETPPNATHWSHALMAEAMGISPSSVGRIWAEAGLKPHILKGFKVSNDPKASLAADRSPYDVVAINMPWLGEFANAGQLRQLDSFITDDNIRPVDYHPSVWSNGNWTGLQYGIPIYMTVEAMAIRRDVFDEHRIDPPRTFEQVIEAGRRLHNPAREFYGIAWNGARGMPIASTFMVLMGCCGASIFNLGGARR